MITSTTGTVFSPSRTEPYTYSEKDYNEESVPKYEAGDREFFNVYFASKILAEKCMYSPSECVFVEYRADCDNVALKEFVEKHKKELAFDYTLIIPPFVRSGPPLFQRESRY